MGNTINQRNNSDHGTEMSAIGEQQAEYYDELINYRTICGFKIKKYQKMVLIWEETLILSCEELKADYPTWTPEIIRVVKNVKLFRTKYLREFYQLKELQKQRMHVTQQGVLTPPQIQEFQQRVRKSILLSSAYIAKNRVKQGSKISTSISPNRKERFKTRNNSMLMEFRKSNLSMATNRQDVRGKSTKGTPIARPSMISFVDDTLSSLIKGQQRQISPKNAYSLQIFVKFTVLLQKHLNDPQHKLSHVKKTFIGCLKKELAHLIKQQAEMGKVINSIKTFLVVFRDSVEDYYNTMSFGGQEKINNFLISNSENILAIVTTILFKDSEFYGLIINQLNCYLQQKNKELVNAIATIRDKPPQFFDVPNEYCLNFITLQTEQQTKQAIEISSQSKEYPYETCVECLNDLTTSKAPITKMKIILDAVQKMTECCQQFYQSHKLQKKSWVFDADQILSIFCYLISKSRIENIYSHLFVLENFATQNQMISMMGYYYSVLTCALDRIQLLGKENPIDSQQ